MSIDSDLRPQASKRSVMMAGAIAGLVSRYWTRLSRILSNYTQYIYIYIYIFHSIADPGPPASSSRPSTLSRSDCSSRSTTTAPPPSTVASSPPCAPLSRRRGSPACGKATSLLSCSTSRTAPHSSSHTSKSLSSSPAHAGASPRARRASSLGPQQAGLPPHSHTHLTSFEHVSPHRANSGFFPLPLALPPPPPTHS